MRISDWSSDVCSSDLLEERCDARDESVELILVHAIVRRRGIGDDFLIIGLARCRAFQILVENEVAILAVTAQDVLQLVAEYEPKVVDPVQPQRDRKSTRLNSSH